MNKLKKKNNKGQQESEVILWAIPLENRVRKSQKSWTSSALMNVWHYELDMFMLETRACKFFPHARKKTLAVILITANALIFLLHQTHILICLTVHVTEFEFSFFFYISKSPVEGDQASKTDDINLKDVHFKDLQAEMRWRGRKVVGRATKPAEKWNIQLLDGKKTKTNFLSIKVS